MQVKPTKTSVVKNKNYTKDLIVGGKKSKNGNKRKTGRKENKKRERPTSTASTKAFASSEMSRMTEGSSSGSSDSGSDANDVHWIGQMEMDILSKIRESVEMRRLETEQQNPLQMQKKSGDDVSSVAIAIKE
jgi:hypothetical protein